MGKKEVVKEGGGEEERRKEGRSSPQSSTSLSLNDNDQHVADEDFLELLPGVCALRDTFFSLL